LERMPVAKTAESCRCLQHIGRACPETCGGPVSSEYVKGQVLPKPAGWFPGLPTAIAYLDRQRYWPKRPYRNASGLEEWPSTSGNRRSGPSESELHSVADYRPGSATLLDSDPYAVRQWLGRAGFRRPTAGSQAPAKSCTVLTTAKLTRPIHRDDTADALHSSEVVPGSRS